MLVFSLLGILVFFAAMAWAFRKTLKTVESPSYVMEGPPLPRELAHTVKRLESWRLQGRISREEHEKLMHLVREDASSQR